jgi:hypothetical protein
MESNAEVEKFSARNSCFYINRMEIDAIMGHKESADAMLLFVYIVSVHGHKSNYLFSLDFHGMKNKGAVTLSIPRQRSARRFLEKIGLLELASNHKAGSVSQKYRLKRLGLSPSKKVAIRTNNEKINHDDARRRIALGYRADYFEIDEDDGVIE